MEPLIILYFVFIFLVAVALMLLAAKLFLSFGMRDIDSILRRNPGKTVLYKGIFIPNNNNTKMGKRLYGVIFNNGNDASFECGIDRDRRFGKIYHASESLISSNNPRDYVNYIELHTDIQLVLFCPIRGKLFSRDHDFMASAHEYFYKLNSG